VRNIIGYTVGFFDLFHKGHLRYLQQAASLCDKLIVGVKTDELHQVHRHTLPEISLADRMEIVREIKGVDAVVIVEDDCVLKAWSKYGYDVLFVSVPEEDFVQTKKLLNPTLTRAINLSRTKNISSKSIIKMIRSKGLGLDLSILICTLKERKDDLDRLMKILAPQLSERVEVLVDSDSGEKSIGRKRNDLLNKATGDYVCFIDDDDTVPNFYVREIMRAIRSQPDCIGFNGICHGLPVAEGKDNMKIIYSNRFDVWRAAVGYYERTICHLNPVRRELALQVMFEEIDHGEDEKYSIKLKHLLNKEVFVKEIMYDYFPHGYGK